MVVIKGKWREVNPSDKKLKRYVEWLRMTDGKGYGCEII